VWVWLLAYLNVVIAIVVQIEHAIQFTISSNQQIIGCLDAFGDSLSCIFLHLYVVEFSADA